jgi:hypothetical protein
MPSDERPSAAPDRPDRLTALRAALLGSKRGRPRRTVLICLVLGLPGLTFLAYELDIFFDSGGVVFVPFHAALIGVIAAFWAGYTRAGLLPGWGLAYLPLLGWRAEWATEISPRPLLDRIAYVVRPDGLVALAVIGAGVALVGFTAGALTGQGLDALRGGPATTTDD